MLALLLSLTLLAKADMPTDVYADESPPCRVRVKFDGITRDMNIADVKYLRQQPGTISHFTEAEKSISSAERLDLLIKANPSDDTPFGVVGNDAKECKGIQAIAEKLKKRLLDKKWPDEKVSEYIVKKLKKDGLATFVIPPGWNASPQQATVPGGAPRR